ncbi:hypothetical protein Pcinc_035511 [Petrolisthes cinctipes]|uniref:Uncharacterized protein n=1 Tax=Petrolisthes cinctipes TaxID=88211 RepID=A0AAE1C0P8_PETCI|nr:hypothetical protein Pcinc_035511 [Petrolisthes cinctipes]
MEGSGDLTGESRPFADSSVSHSRTCQCCECVRRADGYKSVKISGHRLPVATNIHHDLVEHTGVRDVCDMDVVGWFTSTWP